MAKEKGRRSGLGSLAIAKYSLALIECNCLYIYRSGELPGTSKM